MKSSIYEIVQAVFKKYKTTDPKEIADALHAIVLYEPLGTIHGYYNKAYRQKFVHINTDISPYNQYITFCHELGHAIMHPNCNSHFLMSATYLKVNRLELDATYFSYLFFIFTHETLFEDKSLETLKILNYDFEFANSLVKDSLYCESCNLCDSYALDEYIDYRNCLTSIECKNDQLKTENVTYVNA